MKRTHLAFLFVLALLASRQAPAGKGGTIAGKVVVVDKGKKLTKGDSVDGLYVYLEESKPSRRPGATTTAAITQFEEQFAPHVVVIPAGGTVWFPNKDATEHSVFSPQDEKNLGFDLERYGRLDRGKPQAFPDTGQYKIYCDIHMGMWAYVKVVPSRYLARVVNGTFELTGLPPGTYKVWAWAPESLDVPSGWVTVTGEETRTIDELHVQARQRPATHLRSDGSRYVPGGKY